MNVSSRLALSLQRFTQSNRSYTESLADQRVRDGAALGFIEIDTAGESVATIGFPMLFVERPVFTYGLELGESSYLPWPRRYAGHRHQPRDSRLRNLLRVGRSVGPEERVKSR
jgi:hypothetical protein